MKRFIAVVLSISLLFLCSCGPINMSDTGKRCGEISVETVDDFLAGNITASQAEDAIEKQDYILNAYITKQKEELGEETWHNMYSFDQLIANDIYLLQTSLSLYSDGYGTKAEVKNQRNQLNKLIK